VIQVLQEGIPCLPPFLLLPSPFLFLPFSSSFCSSLFSLPSSPPPSPPSFSLFPSFLFSICHFSSPSLPAISFFSFPPPHSSTNGNVRHASDTRRKASCSKQTLQDAGMGQMIQVLQEADPYTTSGGYPKKYESPPVRVSSLRGAADG